MPITRSTSGARCSAAMNGLPISPVGPVTATVSTGPFSPTGAPGATQHLNFFTAGVGSAFRRRFSRPHLEDVLAGLSPLYFFGEPARS